MTRHVVVIGKGLAGAVAAKSAVESGAHVTLVSRGAGRTAFGGGLLDVSGRSNAPLAEALSALTVKNPRHPFARFDRPERLIVQASQLLAALSDGLYLSNLTENALPERYPNEFGLLALSHMAPRTFMSLRHVAPDGNVLLLGYRGYPRFSAAMVARALTQRCNGRPTFRAMEIPIESPVRPWAQPAELARFLDDDKNLERLAELLRKTLPPGSFCMALSPAVLGFERRDRAEILTAKIGMAVVEMDAAQFSVPGLRLALTLEKQLAANGVTLLNAKAFDAKVENRAVKELHLAGENGEKRTLSADAFILASGKFLGGGIAYENGVLFEPIFGLPVRLGAQPLTSIFPSRLSDPDFLADQRFARVGLCTDANFRPLDEMGELFAANLFAAGQVLGGFDAFSEAPDGVDLLTGLAAGRLAAGKEVTP